MITVSANSAGTTVYPYRKKKKKTTQDPILSHTKLKKDINNKTTKLLGKKNEDYFHDLGVGK